MTDVDKMKARGQELMTARRQKALDRVLKALHSELPGVSLSNVIFDAYWEPDYDYGYDCDDLAAVLLPILDAFFARREAARV